MIPIWPEISNDVLESFRSYRIGPATAYNLHNKIEIINDIIYKRVNRDIDYVLFCFGEVDIRAHLLKQSEIQNLPIVDIVNECVDQYFRVILYYKELGYNSIVWGPIASWNELKPYTGGPSFGSCMMRNDITSLFNKRLEFWCEMYSIKFVTIFHKMIDSNGITNPYYLDDWDGCHIHLNQNAMPLILDEFKNKSLL
jgi:hypothetical protein